MSGRERGGALPAAIILQLILLLVGLQVALAAAMLRLAVARTGAQVQAVRLVEAMVGVAAGESGSRLVTALEGDGFLDVDLAPMSPGLAVEPVKVLDDRDGDGDVHRDGNGRVLLVASAGVVPFPGTLPSRATLIRETLIGSRLPLPAALIDCAGGLGLCGGEDGCALPPGRVVAGVAAALAVPEARLAELGQALFILSREVLRAAAERCAGGVCQDQDDRLLRAAATQVMRRLDTADADASGLEPAAVARLVSGLLDLDGSESGAGSFPWWDGTWRGVADLGVLPEAVAALALEAGHVPSLEDHPYPQVLSGALEWQSAAGLCARLPAYLEAAVRRSGEALAAGMELPPASSVTILSAPRRVAAGEILAGQGLLVLREALTIAAGGRLDWQGSVLVDGGLLAGEGSMEIRGSLLVLPPSGPGSIDLATAGLQLVRDEEAHRRAWQAAGNILLSAWYGPEGP